VLHRGLVTAIENRDDRLVLQLERDRRVMADIAVLATGNFPPEAPKIADPSFYHSHLYRPDPWAADAVSDLDPAAPVLLIGTGLTMVDTAISILDRGHRGRIVALSRRGLLPHRHEPVPSAPLLERPLPTGIVELLRLVRHEVVRAKHAGGDWRSVVDGLRPAMLDVWQSMNGDNRARFVRHLRPWWDVHRHRMPRLVAARIAAGQAAGQIVVAAGRILDFRIVGSDGSQIAAALGHRAERPSRRPRRQLLGTPL
jgi:uncharacterized NAD(P)/FAD-binding protein YdhS